MFRRRKAVGTILETDREPKTREPWGWTPSGVQIGKQTLVIGDRTVQMREIVRWPSSLAPAWPSDVLLVGESTLVIRLAPELAEAVRTSVSRSLPRLQSAARESRKKNMPNMEQERQIADALNQLDSIASGQVRHYSTAISTFYWSDSADAAADAGRTAARRGRERGLEVAALSSLQAQSYHGALPGGRPVALGLLFDQHQVAWCWPFVSEDMLDDAGVFVGINERTGGPVLWDRWQPDVTHMIVTADTGYGKSYAVKTIASQEHVRGVPVLVLDPSRQQEYRAWCLALGGQYLALEHTGAEKINLFEVRPDGEALAAGKTPEQTRGRPLSDRIDAVKPVLAALVGESTESGLFDAEIEAALQQVYRGAGFADAWADCFTSRTGPLGDVVWEPEGTWPILSDVRRALQDAEGEEAHRYAKMLAPYCRGGSSDLLDGQTTVELTAPVIGIGVNDLIATGGRFSRAGYAAVVDFAQQHFRALAARRKLMVVDECHNFLGDPVMAKWLERQLREARKAGIGVVAITQGVSDFARHPSGKAVWQNALARFYLHQPAGDLAEAASFLGLDPSVLGAAAHLPRGHGILQVGERVAQVAVTAPTALDAILRSDVGYEERQTEGGGGGVEAG